MAVVAQRQRDWRTGLSACHRCDLRRSSARSSRHSSIVNCRNAWIAASPARCLFAGILSCRRELHGAINRHEGRQRRDCNAGRLDRRIWRFICSDISPNAADVINTIVSNVVVLAAITVIAEGRNANSKL